MKSNGLKGVVRGAKNFIETLIKLQTSEDSFGLNQTMVKFKDQLAAIHEEMTKLPDEAFFDISTKGADPNIQTQKTRNAQALLSVSTNNSGGNTTDVSFAHGTVKKDAPKKRKGMKRG